MPTPPQPPAEHHDEPADGEAARAYLVGFDDAQNVVSQPAPDAPEDIVIGDIGARRLIVSPTAEGVIVRGFHQQVGVTDIVRVGHELGGSEREVRGMLTALNDRGHVVAELDRDNARALAEAIETASRVDPS